MDLIHLSDEDEEEEEDVDVEDDEDEPMDFLESMQSQMTARSSADLRDYMDQQSGLTPLQTELDSRPSTTIAAMMSLSTDDIASDDDDHKGDGLGSPIPDMGLGSALSSTSVGSEFEVSVEPDATDAKPKHHSDIDDFLLEYCTDPQVDVLTGCTVSDPSSGDTSIDASGTTDENSKLARLYREGFLLFIHRFTDSFLSVLTSIETLVKDDAKTSPAQKSGLVRFIDLWMDRYPHDFDPSEIADKVIEIRTVAGATTPSPEPDTSKKSSSKLKKMGLFQSKTDSTPGKSRARQTEPAMKSPKKKSFGGRMTRGKKDSSTVSGGAGGVPSGTDGSGAPSTKSPYDCRGLFDARISCWNDTKHEWLSIKQRKKIDHLPKSYLGKADILVVRDKMVKMAEHSRKMLKKSVGSRSSSKSMMSRLYQMRSPSTGSIGSSKKKAVETVVWRTSFPEYYVGDPVTLSVASAGSGSSTAASAPSSPQQGPVPAPGGGGSKPRLATKTKASKSAVSLADLSTSVAAASASVKRVKSLEDSKPKLTRAQIEQLKEKWDLTWPWLTLYFNVRFPRNLVSVELSSRHVAEAITLLKYGVFMKIDAREFENRGWKGEGKETSPNIRNMIRLFDTEAKWAQMVLLFETSQSARSFKLKRLLKICHELIDLGNYDSACAIRYGIFEKFIMSLPMQDLPTKVTTMLETLNKFDDSRHRNVKDLTDKRIKQGLSVIPLLSVALDKAYRIEEVWKPVNENGLIHLRWLKGMFSALDDQLLCAQRIKVGPSGFIDDPDRIDESKLYYSGITVDRRDIEMLFVSELKNWSHYAKEDMLKMAEVQETVKESSHKSKGSISSSSSGGAHLRKVSASTTLKLIDVPD